MVAMDPGSAWGIRDELDETGKEDSSMIARLRSRWVLTGAVLLAFVSVVGILVGPTVMSRAIGGDAALSQEEIDAGGAVSVAPVSIQVVADASPTTTVRTGRQPVPVRRGAISELLSVSGRVAGVDEVPLTFPTLARVETLGVTAGQAVEEGQALLSAEWKEIAKDLEAARARIEVSMVRLSQAEAQAQARKREYERRLEAERVRQQLAIDEAEAGIRRAQGDYERVRAGAPLSERQAADGAVLSSRSALERAEAELARASAGPSEAELKAADQRVWSTRLAVHRAEAELERLRRGPDPAELRAAEREVTSARTALDRATADLERLARGADPGMVSTAQRDVQRAELALRVASAEKQGKDKNARVAREAAIRTAQLGVQDARERLGRLQVGPPPIEVELARRAMTSAQADLQSANDRLATVNKGPDQLTLASANQVLEEARLAATSAEARYLELEAGPPAERVAAARSSVQNARVALTGAMSRQAEVLSRPTRAELQEAEERIAAARTAAEKAIATAEEAPVPSDDEVDPASFDLVLLQKGVQQDRAAVESLERDLQATRLLAPFSGLVASVQVRPGDPMEPGQPVMTLARPGATIIRADLSEEETRRLTAGQTAVVQVEGAPTLQLDATVTAVETTGNGSSSARFDVNWPDTTLVLGSNAQAIVTLQRKSDVLLIPQRAIRSNGQRRQVEVVEGASRRNVDVQVGVVQGGEAEILSGLTAGQFVMVEP